MTATKFPWESTPTLQITAGVPLRVEVLDQTALPFEVRYRPITGLDDGVTAIRDMWVRGAPLIGVVAAYSLAVSVTHDNSDAGIEAACQALLSSRPTAVNLRWAIERMRWYVLRCAPEQRGAEAFDEARRLATDEARCCERIGLHGADWIRRHTAARSRLNLLTHCNAGWLATGAWGTALAPIYRLAREGVDVHVWVDETRPRNQGARLTAWELQQAGIAHTVVADNAAGYLMRTGQVDVVIVGSDRTTARGDVCNKVGTYQKALAAFDNDIPMLVALPVSTIDWRIEEGLDDIEIECRSSDELLWLEGPDSEGEMRRVRSAAPGSPALNYAFDVTPARLVTALVTEHGCTAPDADAMKRLHALSSSTD